MARRALLRPQGSCVPELLLEGSPLNGRSNSASRPLGTSQGRPVPRRRAGLKPEAGTRSSTRLCVCPGSAHRDTGTIASDRIPRPFPAGGRASKWTRTDSFCRPSIRPRPRPLPMGHLGTPGSVQHPRDDCRGSLFPRERGLREARRTRAHVSKKAP